MTDFPDFDITANAEISNAFLRLDISNFQHAAWFVANLPYRRNTDKSNLRTVFTDQCGTCSTKHAVLCELARENNFKGLSLLLGIFKMNGINTSRVREILEANHLAYIPEAHTYLKYHHQIFDFTKTNSSPADFQDDLLLEIEITPQQITDFKIEVHRRYLQHWLDENKGISYSLDTLWQIREDCIKALSQ